jgi:hypothetical protein
MLEWWENTGNEKTDWGSQVIKFEKDSTFSLYNIDIQKPGIPGYIDMTISYHAAGVIEDLHRMKNVLFPDQGDTVDVVINIGLNIENSQSPSTFSLFNNFPNPFNPFTTINYTIAENGSLVSLIIYDLTGREIRTLVDEIKAPGFYSATWDGRDDTGAAVSSGIYLYRLICGDFEKTGKMALVR